VTEKKEGKEREYRISKKQAVGTLLGSDFVARNWGEKKTRVIDVETIGGGGQKGLRIVDRIITEKEKNEAKNGKLLRRNYCSVNIGREKRRGKNW